MKVYTIDCDIDGVPTKIFEGTLSIEETIARKAGFVVICCNGVHRRWPKIYYSRGAAQRDFDRLTAAKTITETHIRISADDFDPEALSMSGYDVFAAGHYDYGMCNHGLTFTRVYCAEPTRQSVCEYLRDLDWRSNGKPAADHLRKLKALNNPTVDALSNYCRGEEAPSLEEMDAYVPAARVAVDVPPDQASHISHAFDGTVLDVFAVSGNIYLIAKPDE